MKKEQNQTIQYLDEYITKVLDQLETLNKRLSELEEKMKDSDMEYICTACNERVADDYDPKQGLFTCEDCRYKWETSWGAG